MLNRLKARKAELARLREERGATDPILIIAGIAITLILLVGGSFAISGFISNANDLNAKGDLDRIATAQAAYLASNDRYGALSVGPNVGTQNTQLQTGSIGFTPTAGNSTVVRTSASGWVAVTKSASGKVYVRSSTSAQTYEVPGVNVSSSYGAWTDARRNLALNPNAVPGGATYAVQNPVGYTTGVTMTPGAGPNGANAAEFKVSASDNSVAQYRVRLGGGTGNAALFPVNNAVPFSIGFDLWLPASVAGTTLTIEVPVQGTGGGTFRNTFTFVGQEGWQRIERSMTLTPQQGVTDLTAVQYPQIVTAPLRFSTGDTIARISNVSFDTSNDAMTLFSGSSTSDDPAVSYAWTGAANNSSSVMRTRPATGTSSWGAGSSPSGLTLPSGITWTQVSNDLQDVYS